MIKALTWIVVMLLVAGYVAFFAGRYRREQAAKRAVEPARPPPPAATMPTSPPFEPLPPVDAFRAPSAVTGPSEAGRSAPPPGHGGDGASGGEVADLLHGIRLPEDLVPRPDVIPRADVHDRVVFTTAETPADIVRERLTTALEEIGADLGWDDDGELALLSRDGRTGWLRVHPSPNGVLPPGTRLAPTAPSHTVCAEFWTNGG